jgi:YgiT-type zinc finger domain-containing protein
MEETRHLPDHCDNCESPNLREERVRSAFWHDERLVVIEDIPALVCGDCHEQFYEDETVMRIDQMRGEGFPPEQARAELRVPVFSLRGGAKSREAP